jgi:hypothetical protein
LTSVVAEMEDCPATQTSIIIPPGGRVSHNIFDCTEQAKQFRLETASGQSFTAPYFSSSGMFLQGQQIFHLGQQNRPTALVQGHPV